MTPSAAQRQADLGDQHHDWYSDFERAQQDAEEARTKIDQIYDSVLSNARDMRLFGFLVKVANAPQMLAVEIARILGEREDFGAAYWDSADGRHWVLAAHPGYGWDVGVLARTVGGDGSQREAYFVLNEKADTKVFHGKIGRVA